MNDKIENLKEAINYVNARYVFNQSTYPQWAKLDEQEQKFFAIKHSLLHIFKNLEDFEKNRDKKPMTKMIINVIKLADVVSLDLESVPPPTKSIPSLLSCLKPIATECESFDHGEPFDMQNIVDAVADMFSVLRSRLKNYASDEYIFSAIPSYMKTKEAV